MSAVKEIGNKRRYVLAVLVLLMAVVVIAKSPFANTSAASPAAPVAAKQAAPQTNMIGSAAAAIQGAVGDFSKATGAPGTAMVIHSLKNDVSPPLRDIKPAAPQPRQEGPDNPRLPITSQNAVVKDPVVQNWFGSLTIPTPIVSFDGINVTNSSCSCSPPDTQGDVGPNNYVQWTNLAYQMFNKSGTSVLGPVPGNTLWAGFGGACQTQNAGDPITLYDPLADRWMMSQFTSSAPFYQCIAVSTSPDPTGSYNRYAFLESNTLLGDYPHFGVWPDGYYMSVNRFLGTSYDSPAVYAFDRVSMLAGQAATAQVFNPGNYFFALLPSDLDGTTPPPAGAPNYFGTTAGTSNTMRLWKFHVDWTTPANSSFTGPVNLITAPFNPDLPCGASGRNCVPQPGTTNAVDLVGQRSMYRLAYRNFGDHEALVTNQSINVDNLNYSGIRWTEIRDPGGRPYIYQQGTYAPDSTFRWMGSAAMDKDGDIAIGYSASSTTVFPSVRYTGRLVTDPLGTMPQGEGTIMAGTGSQTGSNRWGDYSMLSVDPSDDCTFWYTNEYLATSGGTWRTRVGSFKFPSCGAPTPTGTPPTATRTPSPQPTATATATACANYTNATATGSTIDPGTVDIGNHCDDCVTYITLPFSMKMYDRTFTNAYVSSNGNIQFNSSDSAFGNACLPVSIYEYTIMAYWDDLLTNGTGDGVFTSVTGTAPNRVFNVEWRTHYAGPAGTANFEIRLFEGTGTFEMVYGALSQTGTSQTVGIQRDLGTFSQFSCNTAALSAGLKITWTAPACFNVTDTPTPLPTNTSTPTSVTTATSTPTACSITFSDVATTDYFYLPVRYLYCHGAISGYNDNTFRPGNLTTRGQLSKIVVLAEGWPTYVPTTPTFRDVDTTNPFYTHIETAYHQGIISGYACGTGCLEFRPNNNVTRGQLAKIIVLAQHWEITPPTTPTFRDMSPGDPFYGEVETAYAHNIISGYACGTGCLEYRPGNSATRGQISKIVYLAVTSTP